MVTVGRHAENTITIDGDAVSRCHARFEKRAEGWWVVDNNSTNGTFVNDERVSGALLRCGDRVNLGNTIFRSCCAECGRLIDETKYSTSPIDGLTKAYNRRYLIEQLDAALRRTEHPEHPLALVMFDLDHFKRINDSFGHMAGDQVLREVASLTQQHVRPGDVFARYGGEEFVLMLPGTDLQGAAALAETIRAAVAAHVVTFEEHTISLTISAGVAQADENTCVANDLIRPADERLYQAKCDGRNRVRS
ncbi:GGDEF domain-containing protein [Polyangium jinanense]|uniref:diguanylate cyclase n=1 Tax=Polyangium jinanense TaxID=2829994 RepID=A0A9X3XJL5_9BACT|nr:GGDEF domain-containing protein [Polyangium jinanense]MDC3962661.1 GGDEF domain-containing protein [Polyangium jinanense]MDC3989381.1 GGDEF domain-containing protein [Polyangium jinanense]